MRASGIRDFGPAAGSILLWRAFDRTGSYHALLTELALFMVLAAALMAAMPRYAAESTAPTTCGSGLKLSIRLGNTKLGSPCYISYPCVRLQKEGKW